MVANSSNSRVREASNNVTHKYLSVNEKVPRMVEETVESDLDSLDRELLDVQEKPKHHRVIPRAIDP
jgi:uncharacterized protein with HEPN domain